MAQSLLYVLSTCNWLQTVLGTGYHPDSSQASAAFQPCHTDRECFFGYFLICFWFCDEFANISNGFLPYLQNLQLIYPSVIMSCYKREETRLGKLIKIYVLLSLSLLAAISLHQALNYCHVPSACCTTPAWERDTVASSKSSLKFSCSEEYWFCFLSIF
jgi:hypothetical protein